MMVRIIRLSLWPSTLGPSMLVAWRHWCQTTLSFNRIYDPIVTLYLQDLVMLLQYQPNPLTFEDLHGIYGTHYAWA